MATKQPFKRKVVKVFGGVFSGSEVWGSVFLGYGVRISLVVPFAFLLYCLFEILKATPTFGLISIT